MESSDRYRPNVQCRIISPRKDDIGTNDGMLERGEFLGESTPALTRGLDQSCGRNFYKCPVRWSLHDALSS
ncbi:GTPase-activating protein GYP7 [Fusarium oxysporum f. sp. albedinis]|nr:GTPase-activating protein GYP7 [Fusarium oxysporum f. sp. albedinis]